MSLEQSIANKLMCMFGKAKQEVVAVEAEVKAEVVSTEKEIFEQAHAAALTANAEVNKIKEELQQALAKAATLHQKAIDAAAAAKSIAESEVERFKILVDAHSRDLATQTSVQTIAPAESTQSQ
jgi:multidrug resistance efflux pump